MIALKRYWILIAVCLALGTFLIASNLTRDSLASSGEEEASVNVELGQLNEALANDEELMFFTGKNGNLSAYSLDLEKIMDFPTLDENESNAVAVSPDNSLLVSGDETGKVVVWDVQNQKASTLDDAHLGDILSAAFSPDGKYFATASKDRTIKIWDAVSLTALQTLKGHGSYVLDIDFSPDSKYLASVGSDNLLAVWDVETGDKIDEKKNSHFRAVNQVSYSPDGKHLYTASSDTLIKIWDSENLECLNTLKGHNSEILSLCISPDGKTILSAGRDKTMLCFDAASGEMKARVDLPNNLYVSDILFAGNGSYVYVADMSGNILCMDYQSREIVKETTIGPIYAMGMI